MAITIVGTNQGVLSMGYNPLRYYILSDNVNLKGFRYIVEVFKAGTADKLFEKKYAPRPLDGYGEIDISRDVQNFLSTTRPSSTTQHAENNYLKYDIKFGEEYVDSWAFTDYIFNSGLTGFEQVPNVMPHTFVAGDQISVILDTMPGDFRDALQGLFTVYSVIDGYSFATTMPWIGSGGAVTGRVYFADNRKTRDLDLENMTDQTTVNGAISLIRLNGFDGTEFVLATSPLGKFLTDMPTVRMTTDQVNWLAFFNNYSATGKRIYYKNDAGDIGYRSFSTTTDMGVVQLPSGLGNAGVLTSFSGSLPILKPTTKWIEVYIGNTTVALTEPIRYLIDRRCQISEYQIIFMDRLGSLGSFSFQLRNQEKGNINRLTYNKQFGDIDGGDVLFPSISQGTTTYHVDASRELTLNTNWMTDAESVYFEQLLTSGYTYIFDGTTLQSCIVRESAYETERQINKSLIRKTITVSFAVETPINV